MWLVTEPRKGSGMWYNKLNGIPNIDQILKNKGKAETVAVGDECLTIIRNQDVSTSKPMVTNPTLFELKSEECEQRRLAVCKLKNSNDIFANDAPPQFPCITKTDRRKKRQTKHNEEQQDNTKEETGKHRNLLFIIQ